MLSNKRLIMITALKKIVIPYLRTHDFKGSFPHFRRYQKRHIDLLTFQFNRYGGSFVLELAICEKNGVTTNWGETIRPNKVTAHDVNDRYRLQILGRNNPWFDYENGETGEYFEQVAQDVKRHLHIEDPYWLKGIAEKHK